MKLSMIEIARIAHEVNRGYCEAIGDNSQVAWEQAPEWQRQSAFSGVRAVFEGTARTPEDQHESWSQQKLEDGWQYGEVKDADAKTHPCLVPYAELPQEQKVKDFLFRAVVGALR